MPTLRNLAVSLTACALAFVTTVSAKTPVFTEVVGDKCPVVFVVDDTSKLVETTKASPGWKFWQEAEVQAFFAPAIAKFKLNELDGKCKEHTGHTLSELLGMQKQVVFALKDVKFSADGEKPDVQMVLLLEVGKSRELFESLIKKDIEKEQREIMTEEFQGVQINSTRTTKEGDDVRFFWAFDDEVMLIGSSLEVIQGTIADLRRGHAESPLADSERFRQARVQSEGAPVFGFVNFQAIIPQVVDAFKASTADKQNGGQMMFGITPDAIINALGLDVLDTLYFSSALRDGYGESRFGLTYTERRGLVKLIAFSGEPAPHPVFLSAKYPQAGVSRFSMKSFYYGLEEIVRTASPGMDSMLQARMQDFSKQMGLDIKRDLIGSFGDEVINARIIPSDFTGVPSPELMDQVVAFSLTNSEAFNKAIEILKQLGGQNSELFTKREYLGETIYTMKQMMPPGPKGSNQPARSLSYAVTSRYFLIGIGSASALDNPLQGMKGDRLCVFDDPKVKPLLDQLPEGPVSITVQDTGVMLESLVEMLCKMPALPEPNASKGGDQDADGDEGGSPNGGSKGTWRFVDVKSKPSSELYGKYFDRAISVVHVKDNGVHIIARSYYAK